MPLQERVSPRTGVEIPLHFLGDRLLSLFVGRRRNSRARGRSFICRADLPENLTAVFPADCGENRRDSVHVHDLRESFDVVVSTASNR